MLAYVVVLGEPVEVNAAAEGAIEGTAVTFWKPDGSIEAVLETVFADAPGGVAAGVETFANAVGTTACP